MAVVAILLGLVGSFVRSEVSNEARFTRTEVILDNTVTAIKELRQSNQRLIRVQNEVSKVRKTVAPEPDEESQ